MYVLVVVGLLAGVVTSISPCVLPVLPVVLTASASRSGDRERLPAPAGPRTPPVGTVTARTSPAPLRRGRPSRWRPYGVVAGLVLSFSASTLFGSVVLRALHLPQDLLRDAGIAVLVVLGLGLVVPRFGDLLERPFARLPRRAVNPDGNGIALGLGLGLLYVPCAGPVLAAIAVVGATGHIGIRSIVLTAAFGVGVGLPLLAVAVAGDAVARRTGMLRRRARPFRLAGGVAMILVAAAVGLNLTDGLQRNVPGYTTALQRSVERNSTATDQLHRLTTSGHTGPGASTGTATGGSDSASGEGTCTEGGQDLENCGPAPELIGITGWLNTPGNRPLSLNGLRGRVVLIDFWTYSCINCQRTLPHVEAWYRDYHAAGFEVIGVHTPEFAFEHVPSNVQARAGALGVRYPVAIDNNYATWNAYSNQYWPAEYLVDPHGVIRHVTFGEGDYGGTETLIRQLLADAHPNVTLTRPSTVADTTPSGQQTAETYLGYQYSQRVTGAKPTHDRAVPYRFPATLMPDTFALSGTWTDRPEAAAAGADAKLELSFQARDVYLVLGGTGTVTVRVDGTTTSVVHVTGVPRLYTLVHGASGRRALLTLDVSPGVRAYDFTFG